MRLLLDTHIYLWAVTDNRKLSKQARKLITDADDVFVSSASIWEASIKVGLGKLDADVISRCIFRASHNGLRTHFW